jgi:glycerate-2-kinase
MLSTDERPPASSVRLEKPMGIEGEYEHAIYLLKEYGAWDEIPEVVRQFLLRKDPAYLSLDPSEWYDRPHFRIRVMGPEYMLAAAEQRARDLGLNATIMASNLANLESWVIGDAMGVVAREIERYDRPLTAPAVFLLGGELVVTTGKNPGLGGRKPGVRLGAAALIDGSKRIVVGSADSDGSDGPTDYAGGIVDGETIGASQGRGHRRAGRTADVTTRADVLCGLGRRHRHGQPQGPTLQDLRVVYWGQAE